MMRYGGIDGCRGGWFSVWTDDCRDFSFELLSKLEQIRDVTTSAQRIFVDVPLGLPDDGFRKCDGEARRLLGKRASTIFTAPVYETINASCYEEACYINERLSGKKISRQTWNILPKIREADGLRRTSAGNRTVLREAHPELCFRALRGGRVVSESKKTAPGRYVRLDCLCRAAPKIKESIREVEYSFPGSLVQADDILDALVLCISAALPAERIVTLPEKPQLNSRGERMEIVFNQTTLCSG